MDKANYHLYFASRDADTVNVEKPAILFSPSLDRWNDFAFRTRFTYKVIDTIEQQSPGEVHLAFLESKATKEGHDSADTAEAAIQHSPVHLVSAKELPGFYTMHLNMQEYRRIVRQRGPEGAETLLLSMNDLVALKRAQKRPSWFSNATSSSEFTLSFVRNAETFFAFHNAGSILGGLEQESFGGISNRLQLEFKLPAFSNAHKLEFGFEYDSDLPRRIAVVIGKNGVGKSQTLAHFAKSLLDADRRLRDGNGDPPSIHRLLAVSSPGETRNTFPGPRKRSPIDYHRIILSRSPFGVRQSGLGEALVRLARSEETIREKDRWGLFCNAVSTVLPLNELVVRHRKRNALAPMSGRQQPIPLADMRNGGEQHRLERWGSVDSRADVFRAVDGELFPLSSGQLTFIRFAAQVCLYIENGTMVLIDEPETHLHPNLISDFVSLLDTLLMDTGSFAILATHSAYFVREVIRSQVIVLREGKDKQIEAVTPRLKTLGADIGAISFFVFSDELYGRLLRDISTRLSKGGASATKLFDRLEQDLPPEAFMYLRRELKLAPTHEIHSRSKRPR